MPIGSSFNLPPPIHKFRWSSEILISRMEVIICLWATFGSTVLLLLLAVLLDTGVTYPVSSLNTAQQFLPKLARDYEVISNFVSQASAKKYVLTFANVTVLTSSACVVAIVVLLVRRCAVWRSRDQWHQGLTFEEAGWIVVPWRTKELLVCLAAIFCSSYIVLLLPSFLHVETTSVWRQLEAAYSVTLLVPVALLFLVMFLLRSTSHLISLVQRFVRKGGNGR